jgi:hypothetical protein
MLFDCIAWLWKSTEVVRARLDRFATSRTIRRLEREVRAERDPEVRRLLLDVLADYRAVHASETRLIAMLRGGRPPAREE